MPGDYQIGAYYFPNYHVDPRNEKLFGKGWTEWELVKHATPRFPGHRQPRVPLWGYEDEADPSVFARKIDAAADHGLDYFLFDWYWYNDGAFLNRCLEQGYFNAPNRERLQFALMWAIHNWVDIFPLKRSMANKPVLLYPGAVTADTFERMTDHIVEQYFSKPFYWKINGAPYFSIYELFRFIHGLGGLDPARLALDLFRHNTRRAGFPDLHLNALVWGVQLLPGEKAVSNPKELLSALGCSSMTSYVWVHHIELNKFPRTPYRDVLAQMPTYWQKASTEYDLPYFPIVTMGWDSSPRTTQSDVFDPVGYPFTPTLDGT